jgi:glycyl-tRNA synthetase beta chain
MMKNLLVELGTEELPATALTKLSDAFAAEFTQGLTKAGLHFAKIESFATPRRLALIIHQLDEKQPDSEQDRKGPVAQTAFDANGKPSAACLGFAKSVGAEPEQLKEKEGYLYYTVKTPGKTIYNLVPQILTHAIDKLPIPKRMRWGSHQAQFSRPVHWLVLLYGNEIIPATILELNADRLTYGHRFHHPQAITLQAPEEYENKLAKACVIADFTKRRDSIRQQIDAQAKAAQGYAIIEPDLLDEVTGLVEWPVAITANFNPRFLAVPAQSLITAMQHHQKSFALLDNKQQLIPSFITISNIESKQPDRVRHGNERVMHARLSDAEFFYQTDLKTPLAQHADKLKTVIFQADLGSLWDKTQRLQTLMTALATQCDIPLALANRAAFLAKTDLLTTMVGEFPELQGIMGYYYAKHAGEDNAVALALQEQYLPRFANDELPTSTLGSLLAIADRIDTIVGIFGIDKAPSGEKDPFGLRRAALGIVRIMIDNQLGIDLSQLIELSISSYNNPSKKP